jgi:hypothetical protein
VSWSIYAERLESADLSGSKFQKFFSSTENYFIAGVRSWFVVFGNPQLERLRLYVYELNVDGTLGAEIARSQTSFDLADLKTDTYAAKELYADFSPKCFLNKNDSYAVVPKAEVYVADASNHIAWVRAWADPVTNYTPTYVDLAVAPFKVQFVGATP